MNDKKKNNGTPGDKRLSLLTRNALMALAFTVLIVLIYPHLRTSHYIYEQGRPWNYAQLIAPFDVPIHPDSATVSRKLDSLQAGFKPVYVRTQVNLDSIFRLARARMDAFDDNSGIANAGKSLTPFYNDLQGMIAEAYRCGVLDDSLPESIGTRHPATGRVRHGNMLQTQSLRGMMTRARLLQKADSLAAHWQATRRLQNAGLGAMLPANFVCDITESERILANERALVTIDLGVIQRGQTIIDKGAVITVQDYTNLRTYESMLEAQTHTTDRSNLLMGLGQFLYVALLLGVLLVYAYLFETKAVWQNARAVLFLLSLVTAIFAIMVLVSSTMSGNAIYAIPVALVPVLTVAFFNGRLALMTGMIATMLCAGLSRYQLEFIALQLMGTAAVVYTLRDLRQRAQLLRASVAAIIAYLVVYLALQLMMNGSFDDFSWRIVAALVTNGLLASLAYILMPPLEHTFRFVSDLTLIELTGSNATLLRELSEECPGTYQHSVAVSTLAADAANAVGANALVVRAGAMYHDIGKMDNPIFFTENQHGVNPHDGLTTERSARIIIGHVTDGLKRADKAGLPTIIKNFISQHHGKGLAKYFYITACRQAPEGTTVDPAPYTYPGPNPQTVEASILMMADSVEAASRSMAEHPLQAITELVNRIIDTQLADGLHNDSQLSYRDVPLIKNAFIKRLATMYHSRVAYPTAPASSPS